MVPRATALRVACLCLAAVSCGGEVDYVTSEEAESAPGFRGVERRELCEPGAYRGSFASTKDAFLPLDGKIVVTMARKPSGEFFTVDRESALEAPSLSTGAEVTATVVGEGSCATGDFSAKIVDGLYVNAPDETGVPFVGDVSGEYRVTDVGPLFLGTWTVFVPEIFGDEVVSAGTWIAVLAAPTDAPASAEE